MLLFLEIFFAVFIAEMGDKTQLALLGMTARYKLRDIVLGTGIAILLLNGIAVLAGGIVSSFVPEWIMKLIAAGAFIFFALSSLRAEPGEEEEERKETKHSIAVLAVFGTFFVAEFGDKTQLTAITFGANEGMSAALIVWLACSGGLFAADIIGMLIGYLLGKRIPAEAMNMLAFFLFAVFGIMTLFKGLSLILTTQAASAVCFFAAAGIAAFAVALFRRRRS